MADDEAVKHSELVHCEIRDGELGFEYSRSDWTRRALSEVMDSREEVGWGNLAGCRFIDRGVIESSELVAESIPEVLLPQVINLLFLSGLGAPDHWDLSRALRTFSTVHTLLVLSSCCVEVDMLPGGLSDNSKQWWWWSSSSPMIISALQFSSGLLYSDFRLAE